MYRAAAIEAEWFAPGARPAPVVAVVVPSFRAARSISAVLHAIGPAVSRIYVVDDSCPDATGEIVRRSCRDPRVEVLLNPRNLGVGGAVKQGYRRALAEGADIVVKLDADGQMDPAMIPLLLRPILEGRADYAKGNRFAPAAAMPGAPGRNSLQEMPLSRRWANRLLTLAHKPVTGQWQVADPANGFTAIDARTLARLDLTRIADCFFFETDMLFALGRSGARVADVPLPARYGDERSSLSLVRVAPRFGRLLAQRLWRRLFAPTG